ncbi:MAG: NAD(P)/FAD-dependent oxidoreductase, partial [Bacillota bacterium]|nr:NAD(P)/FAD-dependent oxidoreductase [Bacillota bacterium]
MSMPRLVVLGAGYGGIRFILKLKQLAGNQLPYHLTVVDQRDYHLLSQLLHEAATERVSFEEITLPIREIVGPAAEVITAPVVGLDPYAGEVILPERRLPYDYLVVALGSETDFFEIPGLEQHSFTLKSLDDAVAINAHVHTCFQKAAGLTAPRERAPWLTFVVGGGGFAGTQMAGELAEWLPRLADFYRLPRQELRLVLLEAAPQILRGFDPVLAPLGEELLRRKGVEVHLDSPVRQRTPEEVVFGQGERIATQTLIWTGGVRGTATLERLHLPLGPRQRLQVDSHLRVRGHERIYAVGDNALITDPETGKPLPTSAQYALQQGDVAALNLWAEWHGRPLIPYEPKIRGIAISIGREEALATIGSYRFTGLQAALFKQLILLKYIFSLRNLRLVVRHSSTPLLALCRRLPCRIPVTTPQGQVLRLRSRSAELGDLERSLRSTFSPRRL